MRGFVQLLARGCFGFGFGHSHPGVAVCEPIVSMLAGVKLVLLGELVLVENPTLRGSTLRTVLERRAGVSARSVVLTQLGSLKVGS